MKKIKSLLLYVSVLAGTLLTVSCSDDDKPSVKYSVSPEEIVLTSEKDASSSFVIEFDKGDGNWKIAEYPEFVSVYPLSGTGRSTVRVTALGDNKSKNPLEGDIVVEVAGAKVKRQIVHVAQQNLSDCYVEPANILQMCDGLAFNWTYGHNVKYYYWNIFTQSDYNKMSESEIISQVATGKVDDRNVPDNDRYACFYNLNANSQYVVVTVSYAEGDRQGDIVSTPLTTKSSANQPEATINDLSYIPEGNDKYSYGWNVVKNTYCREYYTYAAASPDYFATYYYLEEGCYPLIAWALRNEILKNGEDHTTSINEGYIYMPFDNGRDKFYGAQVENGQSKFTAFPYTDNYMCIITWGTNTNGELSGTLDAVWADLTSDDDEVKERKVLNAMSPKKTNSGPKKISINTKDIQLIPLN